MSIFVVANKRVSELGASYILLEESDDGGKTWSTLALGMKLARLLETPVEELFTLEG